MTARDMMTTRRVLFFPLLALLAAGCARKDAPPTASSPALALRKVRLLTDWLPQAEHGGFYQALVRGYYAAAGLDVEILPGGPNPNIRPRVAAGEVEFGMNRSDGIIAGVDTGLPLVITGAFLQHDHLGLLLHADDPAKTFADLNGRTLTVNVGLTWIPFLQKKYGITFNLRPVTGGLATFFADPSEIHQCVVTSEPFIAAQRGVTVRTLAIADSGYDIYHVIFTRQSFAREAPEVVRAFTTASLRGWDDYIKGDPGAAHAEILRRNQDMTAEQLAFSRGELVKRALVHGDPAQGDVFGKLSTKRLAGQIAVLREFGVIKETVAPTDLATTDALVP